MAYSRPEGAIPAPDAGVLTSRLVGIGINLAAKAECDADIEAALVHASEEGMESDDLRVLALLVTWLGIHHRMVVADRLFRMVASHPSDRVRVFWSAVSTWLKGDRRFRRLESLSGGGRLALLRTGSAFQVKRHGEDERFVGSALKVPGNALRDRSEDVLSPQDLAKIHHGYHLRVMMGAGWRAHLWSLLEAEPSQSIAEAARSARCSFAVAWEVARDFRTLGGPAVGTDSDAS